MLGTRHLQGGKKLGLDTEFRSNNHRGELERNTRYLENLRIALVRAERDGRYSAAKKIRREINKCQEVELLIRHSWCGGCFQVLHNCRCK
jgi:HKD family nuclease